MLRNRYNSKTNQSYSQRKIPRRSVKRQLHSKQQRKVTNPSLTRIKTDSQTTTPSNITQQHFAHNNSQYRTFSTNQSLINNFDNQLATSSSSSKQLQHYRQKMSMNTTPYTDECLKNTYIFMDLDGTLLPSKTTIIPQHTTQILQKLGEKDAKRILITGRNHASTKYIILKTFNKYQQELSTSGNGNDESCRSQQQLKNNNNEQQQQNTINDNNTQDIFDYIVSSSGAAIADRDFNIIHKSAIPLDIVADCVSFLHQNELSYFIQHDIPNNNLYHQYSFYDDEDYEKKNNHEEKNPLLSKQKIKTTDDDVDSDNNNEDVVIDYSSFTLDTFKTIALTPHNNNNNNNNKDTILQYGLLDPNFCVKKYNSQLHTDHYQRKMMYSKTKEGVELTDIKKQTKFPNYFNNNNNDKQQNNNNNNQSKINENCDNNNDSDDDTNNYNNIYKALASIPAFGDVKQASQLLVPISPLTLLRIIINNNEGEQQQHGEQQNNNNSNNSSYFDSIFPLPTHIGHKHKYMKEYIENNKTIDNNNTIKHKDYLHHQHHRYLIESQCNCCQGIYAIYNNPQDISLHLHHNLLQYLSSSSSSSKKQIFNNNNKNDNNSFFSSSTTTIENKNKNDNHQLLLLDYYKNNLTIVHCTSPLDNNTLWFEILPSYVNKQYAVDRILQLYNNNNNNTITSTTIKNNQNNKDNNNQNKNITTTINEISNVVNNDTNNTTTTTTTNITKHISLFAFGNDFNDLSMLQHIQKYGDHLLLLEQQQEEQKQEQKEDNKQIINDENTITIKLKQNRSFMIQTINNSLLQSCNDYNVELIGRCEDNAVGYTLENILLLSTNNNNNQE